MSKLLIPSLIVFSVSSAQALPRVDSGTILQRYEAKMDQVLSQIERRDIEENGQALPLRYGVAVPIAFPVLRIALAAETAAPLATIAELRTMAGILTGVLALQGEQAALQSASEDESSEGEGAVAEAPTEPEISDPVVRDLLRQLGDARKAQNWSEVDRVQKELKWRLREAALPDATPGDEIDREIDEVLARVSRYRSKVGEPNVIERALRKVWEYLARRNRSHRPDF